MDRMQRQKDIYPPSSKGCIMLINAKFTMQSTNRLGESLERVCNICASPHISTCKYSRYWHSCFPVKSGCKKQRRVFGEDFWQVRARLVSQISFQNQSMVIEPVEIQGVWRTPKTSNNACSGRLGLGAFSRLFLDFGIFPYSSFFLPSRR